MKRKEHIKYFVATLFIMVMIVGAFYFAMPTILRTLYVSFTVYSEGYSNGKWEKIVIGMDKDDLRGIIGEPIEIIDKGNSKTFSYSRASKMIDSYYMKWVTIDRTGKVTKIGSKIYYD